VFFTFEAPLLRIVALYSNVLEDPGVIASKEIGTSQLDYLKAALTRAKDFQGALILAHHHPAYTVGSKHSERGYAGADRQYLQRNRGVAARCTFGARSQLPAFHPRWWPS
jgi:hypothetical protein